jgi:hypothetical protein
MRVGIDKHLAMRREPSVDALLDQSSQPHTAAPATIVSAQRNTPAAI